MGPAAVLRGQSARRCGAPCGRPRRRKDRRGWPGRVGLSLSGLGFRVLRFSVLRFRV